MRELRIVNVGIRRDANGSYIKYFLECQANKPLDVVGYRKYPKVIVFIGIRYDKVDWSVDGLITYEGL